MGDEDQVQQARVAWVFTGGVFVDGDSVAQGQRPLGGPASPRPRQQPPRRRAGQLLMVHEPRRTGQGPAGHDTEEDPDEARVQQHAAGVVVQGHTEELAAAEADRGLFDAGRLAGVRRDGQQAGRRVPGGRGGGGRADPGDLRAGAAM